MDYYMNSELDTNAVQTSLSDVMSSHGICQITNRFHFLPLRHFAGMSSYSWYSQ